MTTFRRLGGRWFLPKTPARFVAIVEAAKEVSERRCNTDRLGHAGQKSKSSPWDRHLAAVVYDQIQHSSQLGVERSLDIHAGSRELDSTLGPLQQVCLRQSS